MTSHLIEPGMKTFSPYLSLNVQEVGGHSLVSETGAHALALYRLWACASRWRTEGIVQLGLHQTLGQEWTVLSNSIDLLVERPGRRGVQRELTAEEHEVLRNAIWESAEIVAPGRFVEDL